MSDFRFADAQFVHALWGVAVFVGLLLWLERRGGNALERLVAAPLQDRLVERPGSWRRTLRVLLVGLAAVAAVLALMRPQWGMREVASSRVGAKIMVALDVSRSMLAEDVAPNRLERAKAEIVDLLPYLSGDQVGLIAFAGRASVLSPLTPDFGFLRLVLENTGAGSVTRGGTRLAEPIRKAVAGFGPTKGASRALLLITDGEDHDSFAIDAAKVAAEAGVKIIAIGFGDEEGSEIRVTDRRTGARQAIRDADGRPVISRLDGTLLREIALATGGAYVPAGTGVLDLASIYDQHIARLTRGDLKGRRTVREEGYPWFVLLALIFLVSSAAVSGGRLFGSSVGERTAMLGLVLLALVSGSPTTARAQASAAEPALPAAPVAAGEVEASANAAVAPAAGEPVAVERTPREVYNEGVVALEARDLEDAERAFTNARRDAKGDDELRYHAAFNLGWVAVGQAGRIRGDAPQEALTQLYRAADWFREAVRLAPEDEDARRNLEVALKQALVLADELARSKEGGVDGALKELADRQREEVSRVAQLVEQVALEASDGGRVDDSPTLRGAFRAGATAQRAVLSDADELAALVAEERAGLEARAEEDRTVEDAMREAQLGAVLEYLHRARERMGQARRQLRERRGERGYRRTSAALHELKRALDQLRDPISMLDQLLREGSEVARATLLLELTARQIPGLQAELPPVPAWLSVEGVAADQRSQAMRIAELEARLIAGLEQSETEQGVAPEQVELLAAVREAEPHVRAASESAQRAAEALEADELASAPEPQRETLRALAAARERFLDLRGLIDATHAAQQQIGEVMAASAQAEDRGEYQSSLLAGEQANLERGERLEAKLQAMISKLSEQRAMQSANDAQDPAQPQPQVDPEQLDREQERLDVAGQLLTLALAGMDGVARELSAGAGEVDWPRAGEDHERAALHLEALQQLFFSIVEHIKQLAREQVGLSDQTQDAVALAAGPDASEEQLVAPLLPVQQELAARALALANALEQQSSEAAAATAEAPEAEEAATRLRAAGEHVLLSQAEMESAAAAFEAPIDWETARGGQDRSLAELQAALEILEPKQEGGDQGEDGDSQEQQQQQKQQEQQEQEPQEQQQNQDGSPEQQQEGEEAEPESAVDPGQMLQEVRDREAQRRRDRSQRNPGYETVEKDW